MLHFRVRGWDCSALQEQVGVPGSDVSGADRAGWRHNVVDHFRMVRVCVHESMQRAQATE